MFAYFSWKLSHFFTPTHDQDTHQPQTKFRRQEGAGEPAGPDNLPSSPSQTSSTGRAQELLVRDS